MVERENNKLNKQIDLQNIKNNPIVQCIINILFVLSVTALTFILIEQQFASQYTYILLPSLSFAIAAFIAFKMKFVQKTFEHTNILLLIASSIIGIFEVIHTVKNMDYEENINCVRLCIIISIPAVTVFFYWFYSKALYYFKQYKDSLDKIEKRYLMTTFIIISLSICIIYNITDVFYKITTPEEKYNYELYFENYTQENEIQAKKYVKYLYNTNQYDIIYTSDTSPLVRQDVYNLVATDENDIRQPLFGVFSIPFHVIPRMIASVFPQIDNLYAILIAIVQAELACIAFTLLARLMKIKNISKGLFLATMTLSYPALLFTLNLEQYTMSIFYLVVFIYMAIEKQKDKDIAYIAATGSMLTTGILFPLLGEAKNWKQSLKNVFFTFLKCMAIFIISARIILVFPEAIEKQLGRIKQFSTSTEYATIDKFCMYTNFIKNTLIFSEFEVQEYIAASKEVKLSDESRASIYITMPTIRQKDTTYPNILGCIIFIITTLSFWINRKDKFTKICFIWTIFSFVLLFVLGWGTNENGLILYTYYFSWAFICLLYKLIENILQNKARIKNTLYTIMLIGISVMNVYGIYKTIQFGLEFFS